MEERTRIEQELHDHLIQEVVGIGMLGAADELTPQRPVCQNSVATRAHAFTGRDRQRAANTQTLRRRPSTGASLLESLRQRADVYPWRDGTEVEYRNERLERLLRPEVADDLIELGSEALRNALRHAAGSNIQVLVHYGSSTVELIVRDHVSGIMDAIMTEGIPGH